MYYDWILVGLLFFSQKPLLSLETWSAHLELSICDFTVLDISAFAQLYRIVI